MLSFESQMTIMLSLRAHSFGEMDDSRDYAGEEKTPRRICSEQLTGKLAVSSAGQVLNTLSSSGEASCREAGVGGGGSEQGPGATGPGRTRR